MRILLDNCVPVDLAPHIRGHEVVSAVDMGWAALDDGALLDALTWQFDVLLTVDKSIPFQQLLTNRAVAVILLRASSNRVGHLARLVPALLKALKDISRGEIREITS